MIGSGTNLGQLTYNVGGFAAGLDRMVAPGLSVGVTAGYTTGTQWTQGFSGQGTTDTFLAGLYGNYRMDKVYADAVFGYGYSYNRMSRQIFIPGLQPRTAQGNAGANQWYGQIEGGYRFDIGQTAADGLHHAVRAPAGLHRRAERLHRNGRAVAQPHGGGADHELAAIGDRRPASAARSTSAGARSWRCRSGWAGATSMPTRRGR